MSFIIRELNTDRQMVAYCANIIATEVDKPGIAAHLKACTLAAALPLVAVADAFACLTKLTLCLPVVPIKLVGRLLGLCSSSNNFTVTAQAWRVIKVLVLLTFVTLATTSIPFVLIFPRLAVLECDFLRLRPSTPNPHTSTPTRPIEPHDPNRALTHRNARIVTSLTPPTSPQRNVELPLLDSLKADVQDFYRNYRQECQTAKRLIILYSLYKAWCYRNEIIAPITHVGGLGYDFAVNAANHTGLSQVLASLYQESQ